MQGEVVMAESIGRRAESSDTGFLSEGDYWKEILVHAQKTLADYQDIKREEELSGGRRRWLNNQIDKKREEIKKADSKLEELHR